MTTAKCGCVYSDARNNSSVRKGFEIPGSLMEMCAAHKAEHDAEQSKDAAIYAKLALAAKAMGGVIITYADGSFTLNAPRITKMGIGTREFMRPDKDDCSCARMCAILGIDTCWRTHRVRCAAADGPHVINVINFTNRFSDFGGDKMSAWRSAALDVAAELGARK